MDTKDRLFDQQVHDAYERIELSDEASERMLAQLLAAQGQQQAEVVLLPSKRRSLPIWLPVAAVVLAALVIVRVGGLTHSKNAEYAQTVALVQDERAAEAASNDMVEEEALVAEGAVAYDYDALPLAELYPLVTLQDGTVLAAREEGQYPVEVDKAELGASIGAAVASASGSEEQLACEVFELAGDPKAYAVRYEGELSYWRCVPMGQ